MKIFKILSAALILCLSAYLFSASGMYAAAGSRVIARLGENRMKNVVICEDGASVPTLSERQSSTPPPSPTASPLPNETPSNGQAAAESELMPDGEPFITNLSAPDGDIFETTITGGLTIKNETNYSVDIAGILAAGPPFTLDANLPQILIIHTHSSEAYTQAGLDRYDPSDTNRTENTEFNIVRIGDELTAIFQDFGLNVIHDRGIYDYPSYTGSYTRSGEAVARYLQDYPSIKIVLDIHRDALGSDGVVYKTMAEEDGVVSSQVMLLAGSDESGLEHPNWRQNLSFALYLQNAVHAVNPTLMRPVSLVRERYNQHLAPGFVIIEVGSNGNTLQEALAAVRLFGNAAAPSLLALVAEPPAEDGSAPE